MAKKTSLGGNGKLQGQWTQAGAAALLVRLYMNAKVYIGEDHFADAEQYAQDIVDGSMVLMLLLTVGMLLLIGIMRIVMR